MEKVKKYVNVKAQGQIPTRSNEPTKGTTQQDYAIVTNRRASPGPPKRKDVKDNIKQRRANDKKKSLSRNIQRKGENELSGNVHSRMEA